MVFLPVLLLLACIYAAFASKGAAIPKEYTQRSIQKKLYQMSVYSWQKYLLLQQHFGISSKKQKLKEALQGIEPGKNSSEMLYRHSIDKMAVCILAVMLGSMLSLAVWMSAHADATLQEEGFIRRNSYGEGSIQTTLSAHIQENNTKEEITVEVLERKYTDIEIDKMYQAFLTELCKKIKGKNESLQSVRYNLYLPTKLEGYPFAIEWECSDYSLMNASGELDGREVKAKGESVILTAAISYYEKQWTYVTKVILYPKEKTPKERQKEKLISDIEESNRKTEQEDSMLLPKQVEGKNIVWKEEKKNSAGILFLLLLGVILLLWFGKDKELYDKLDKRNAQMLTDYPEIVGKLTLLLTAGMTVRSAWKKMVSEYEVSRKDGGCKRYAYEEMLITYHEMESGISENKSYDNFAKRCRVPSYLKLGVLLAQNIKKGSANLVQVLQKEAKDAFEERKNTARKLGEEAGTKLLLPMMLMLGVVIVIIIVPAFLSFSI